MPVFVNRRRWSPEFPPALTLNRHSDQRMDAFISKMNPAVPRHFLFALAGLLWAIAGAVLCFRGFVWIQDLWLPLAIGVEAVGIALAAVGYIFMFSRLVRKNIVRIGSLPNRACVFAFAAWKGYLMIIVMMSAGIALRNSSIPRLYLALPYTSMGWMLLIGSIMFSRQFLVARQARPETVV